jgi:hypothetical protein
MLTFETTEMTGKVNLPLCRTECPYTAQQLPLFLTGQINKAVLCTNIGNVKCVNSILELFIVGGILLYPHLDHCCEDADTLVLNAVMLRLMLTEKEWLICVTRH